MAGANEFSISQQKDIFDYFSKFRIYNCIIVSQEHDVITKEYSLPTEDNDVGTCMKLGVYTWFPYQSSDRCTEVKGTTLLDTWVISAQGHFTKNTDLYPRKFCNSFKGCPMKALVFDGQWFFTTKYENLLYSNGTVVTHITGLEIELLKFVMQQMNLTYVHIPTPDNFETEKHLVNYLIRATFIKEYYIIVGRVGNFLLLNPIFSSTNT